MNLFTFHYVRDPAPPFSGIKACSVGAFDRLLDDLTATMSAVTVAEVIGWTRGETELPPDAFMLTFDDGLVDHGDVVLPRLEDHGLQGIFFVIDRAVRGGPLLPTHAIQHLLAVGADPAEIRRRLDELLSDSRVSGAELPSDEWLWAQWGKQSRFDRPEVTFLKRALGGGLPEPVRSEVQSQLFAEFVGVDAGDLARDLYLDTDAVGDLVARGQVVGGHGVEHFRLAEVDDATLVDELEGSLEFVRRFGGSDTPATICYPFGSVDQRVARVAAEVGFEAGFTTVPRRAHASEPLLLSRFDVNDAAEVLSNATATSLP